MAIKHLRTAFASQYQPGQPARLVAGEAMQEPGGDYEALHKQMKRLFNRSPARNTVASPKTWANARSAPG